MSRNVVTFHYTLRDLHGAVIDASLGGEPISFLEGGGQIVEGLEEGLRGLTKGTRARIEVPAAKAYGERDEAQVQRVLRSLLPLEGEIRPGDQFRAGSDDFAPIVTVRAIDGEELLLDANHPLAGVDLVFEIEVLALRAATQEECMHGHVHGKACCWLDSAKGEVGRNQNDKMCGCGDHSSSCES